MGAGKSRISHLRSGPNGFEASGGVLGSGGEDGVYASADADTLAQEIERVYYDDGEEIDMSLVDELNRQGIKVDIMGITTNDVEVPKVVKNLVEESGISVDEFAQVFSGKTRMQIQEMVTDYFDGTLTNIPDSVKKVLEARGDLGARSSAAFDTYFSTMGKGEQLSDLYGENSRGDINQNVNATLRIASQLAKVSGDGFPSLLFMGSIPSDRGKAGSSPMGQYNDSTKRIEFSTQQLMRNESSFRNRSWSIPANLNLQASSVIHEYGHYIDHSHRLMSGRIRTSDKAVSCYGDTNQREAFAEAFTAYCLGATPKRGSAYYKEFCDLMDSEGLSRFKGCLL